MKILLVSMLAVVGLVGFVSEAKEISFQVHVGLNMSEPYWPCTLDDEKIFYDIVEECKCEYKDYYSLLTEQEEEMLNFHLDSRLAVAGINVANYDDTLADWELKDGEKVNIRVYKSW